MVKRGRVIGYTAGGAALALVIGTLLFGGPGTPIIRAVGINPLLSDRTEFREALDVVPLESERMQFTDWAIVRDALGADLGPDSAPAEIEEMITKAYDTDLSASSSIEGSAVALQRYFGFSPATILWEAYSQTETGAAMVVRVPDEIDLDDVRDNLVEIGFTKPAKDTGVWDGGIDLIAALDGTLTPKLQYVAVLEDQHLVVTSESHDYVAYAVEVALGKKDSLGDSGSARKLVESIDGPASAQFWVDEFACTDLSMGSATEEDQAQAAALVRQAGKISPLSGLLMSMAADRTFTVSELFESDQQAKDNLEARARLIVGAAPGIGGSFSDNMTLTSSKTSGPTVQLVLEPRAETGFILGALNQGPVLFATC